MKIINYEAARYVVLFNIPVVSSLLNQAESLLHCNASDLQSEHTQFQFLLRHRLF
jgi:hypothetical protein